MLDDRAKGSFAISSLYSFWSTEHIFRWLPKQWNEIKSFSNITFMRIFKKTYFTHLDQVTYRRQRELVDQWNDLTNQFLKASQPRQRELRLPWFWIQLNWILDYLSGKLLRHIVLIPHRKDSWDLLNEYSDRTVSLSISNNWIPFFPRRYPMTQTQWPTFGSCRWPDVGISAVQSGQLHHHGCNWSSLWKS